MKTNSKKWLKRLGIFLGTLILIVVGYVVYVFSSYYRLEAVSYTHLDVYKRQEDKSGFIEL